MFTWIDWVILVVIAFSAMISVKRGFFKETLSICSWVLSIVVAWSYSDIFSHYLTDYITTPSIRKITSSIMIFLVVLLGCSLLTNVFVKLVHTSGLTGTDRMLGLVFGAIRGVIIVVALVGLIRYAPIEQDDAWKHSQLLHYFIEFSNSGKVWVSEQIKYISSI